MTLYIIGLGLGDEKDISVRGLEIVKKCSRIYLENYTSILSVTKEKLEEFYGKKIILAYRELIESSSDGIIDGAKNDNIALLIVGNPFSATTHIDIKLRALEKGVDVKIIHNASILTAIGETGLELYKFGRTTSLPFNHKDIKSTYQVYETNKKLGMHTLVLLDLSPKENKFMNVHEVMKYFLKFVSEELKVVVCCGLGMDNQIIKYGSIRELLNLKFEVYPQCLILPGELHFMEEESLSTYSL